MDHFGGDMDVTVVDMKHNLEKILDAISRNETVTLSSHGKPVARIEPISAANNNRAVDHPAFGMWKDRESMEDPSEFVSQLRKGRYSAL